MRKRTSASIITRCFFHGGGDNGEFEVIATQCFPTSSPSSDYRVIAMGLSHVHPKVFGLTVLGCFASGLLLPSDISLSSHPTIPSSSSGQLESSSQNISVSAQGFQSNLTFLNADTINIANTKPVCNGTMFGTNLKINSCWDALKLLGTDTTPTTFGDRGLGLNIQLPRRYSSCM